MIRDLSNATIAVSPLVRPGMTAATMVFVSTSDTRNLFTGGLQAKMSIFNQVALPELPRLSPRKPRPGPPRLLFGGRLLYWKGVHIAIEALARLHPRIAGARLTIVGDGPERNRLRQLAVARGIGAFVDFVPRLEQQELFAYYDSYDLLLFPSLHDSGGFVVLEALSHGLPAVCLDLGGPKEIVTPRSGAIIRTAGRNSGQVAEAIADEIFRLVTSPGRLSALSAGAIARGAEFLLSDRVAKFYARVASVIETEIAKTSERESRELHPIATEDLKTNCSTPLVKKLM
jgi:glycosyltransferase involved in cell wall biosynthesis